MARFVAKAVLMCVLMLAASLPATAQGIKNNDDVIWSNPASQIDNSSSPGSDVTEFKAQCGPDSKIENLFSTGGGSLPEEAIGSKNYTVTNSEIGDKGRAGKIIVNLTCANGDSYTKPFEFRRIEADVETPVMRYDQSAYGKGRNISGTEDPEMGPPDISIGLAENSKRPEGSVALENFEAGDDGDDLDIRGETSKTSVGSDQRISFPIYPFSKGNPPSGDGPVKDGSYDFDLVFEPEGSGVEISLGAEQLTDGEDDLPRVKVYPQYRITDVTKETKASRDSLMSYEDLQGFTYKFDLTHLGEPVKLESDEGVPRGSGYIDTAVYTYSTDDRDGEIYNGYEQENWFNGTRHIGGGRWATSLGTSPVLESGKYRLVNKINLPDDGRGPIKLGEIFVERNMDFNGKVVDSSSSRNPIDATFRFFDGGTKENEFSTAPDGAYRSRVDRKTYDSVEMDFYDERSRSSATESYDARVTASDVEIGDNQGSVRFDYFMDPSVSIPGISPVNMMAVQFGYDLGEVTEIEMAYDSGSVSVDEAQVFECSNWNYFARSCQSEWRRLNEDDYDVNPVSEQVSITGAEPYVLPEDLSSSRNSQRILKNAYVVGTSSSLRLDGNIDVGAQGGRVPVNSEFSVSGNVATAGGSAAEGADVTVNLSVGEDEYGSATGETDANGRFSVDLRAPEDPGNYSVSVSAEKQPYEPLLRTFDRSLTAHVETGVDVSLEGAEAGQLSLVKGRRTTEDIKIANTGQRPVEDVSVSVSDLDEEFFNLSTRSVGEIGVGETASVDLEVLIPESFALNQFPSFSVSASGVSDGDEVSSTTEVFTVVNTLSDENKSDGETGPGSGDGGSSQDTSERNSTEGLGAFLTGASLPTLGGSATADFVEDTSNVNLGLGLLFVFLLVVAAAVKKNNDDSSRRSRDGVSHNRPAVTSVSSDSAATQSGVSAGRGSGADSSAAAEMEASSSMEGAVCGECGEEFDTGAALDMHQETAH